MPTLRFRVLTLITALLAACAAETPGGSGAADNSGSAPPTESERFEHELGGPEELMRFFRTESMDTISDRLARHGMRAVRHETPVADMPDAVPPEVDPGPLEVLANIYDPNEDKCPQYFPEDDRRVWHLYDDEYYYIDDSGRPESAYTYVPPVSSSPRAGWCQASVGHWGKAEDPSNEYDGGHLIGSSLGGFGQRLNLVPQHRNFNRGNWAQLENSVAKCSSVEQRRVVYRVSVEYRDAVRLVPHTFRALLQDQTTGRELALAFPNVAGGGANGTVDRNRGGDFLTQTGCVAERSNAIEANDPDEVEIMIVGDSITHGNAGDFTWRYRLHEHLRASHVQFDFVGPSDAPLDGSYAVADWDQAHAAAWGQATAQAKELIEEDVAIYQPDLVLVHLGTNDLTWLNGTPSSARADMAELIDRARWIKPDTDFVIGQIGDTGPLEDGETLEYNRQLGELAVQKSTPQSQIAVADVDGPWDWRSDTYDQTHPNARGETVIAAAFAGALHSQMHIGDAPAQLPPAQSGPPAPQGVTVNPPVIRPDQPFTVSWQRVNNPGIWTPYKVQITYHHAYGGAVVWQSEPTPNTELTYNGPPLPQTGVFNIVVVATDGTHDTPSDPIDLLVGNGPPKPGPVTVWPRAIRRDEPFTVSWPRVNNPGVWTPYKVQIRYHHAYGGLVVWESQVTPNIELTYNGPPLPQNGVFNVVVVATDGTFDSESDPVDLLVGDGPPKPDPVTVWPTAIRRDQPFTVSWPRVNNPGIWTPYKVQVRYHHAYGGAVVWESQVTPNTELTYDGPALPQTGVFNVVVLATDGTFDTPSDPVDLLVSDGPPATRLVTVDPNLVYRDQRFKISWPRVDNPGIWTTYRAEIHYHRAYGFGLVWASQPTTNTEIYYDGPNLPQAGIYHVVVWSLDGTFETMSEPAALEVLDKVVPPPPPPPPDDYSLEPRYYQMKLAPTRMCMDVEGSSHANEARVVQMPCNGSRSQQWTVRMYQDTCGLDKGVPVGVLFCVQFINLNSGKCMDVAWHDGNNGAKVQQLDCRDVLAPHVGAQVFPIFPGEGWDDLHFNIFAGARDITKYGFQPACLDIPHATTQPGTQLQIWDCNAQPQQDWYLPGFSRFLDYAWF